MISIEEEFEVAKSPSEAFALLDDLAKTPEWNTRCVEIAQSSPGPRAVGSKLRYKYRDPGRVGEMEGTVTAYEKDRALTMSFVDKMLDIVVGFSLAPTSAGTRIRHSIAITPKSFLAKLMTPVIRGATRRQTTESVARIKRLLS